MGTLWGTVTDKDTGVGLGHVIIFVYTHFDQQLADGKTQSDGFYEIPITSDDNVVSGYMTYHHAHYHEGRQDWSVTGGAGRWGPYSPELEKK